MSWAGAYMKGIMEMNPAAVKKMYPDANFSMRVSYGNVKATAHVMQCFMIMYVRQGDFGKYVPW